MLWRCKMEINGAQFFRFDDYIVMVIETSESFEYYVRDKDNRFAFHFMFGVKEPLTYDHLDDLACSGYFESFLEDLV